MTEITAFVTIRNGMGIVDRRSLFSMQVAKIRHTIERVVWISSDMWRFGLCLAVSLW